jgi:hypothetical protein
VRARRRQCVRLIDYSGLIGRHIHYSRNHGRNLHHDRGTTGIDSDPAGNPGNNSP